MQHAAPVTVRSTCLSLSLQTLQFTMYMYRFTDYMYVRFTVHSAAARSAQFLYRFTFCLFCEPAERRIAERSTPTKYQPPASALKERRGATVTSNKKTVCGSWVAGPVVVVRGTRGTRTRTAVKISATDALGHAASDASVTTCKKKMLCQYIEPGSQEWES